MSFGGIDVGWWQWHRVDSETIRPEFVVSAVLRCRATIVRLNGSGKGPLAHEFYECPKPSNGESRRGDQG